MNQARNDDGPYDNGWYEEDRQLPPSLGVWPLGRTYVHSSDGALNTGPPGAGATTNGHGPASGNGHGASDHGPASGNGHGANGHGPAPVNGYGSPSASGRRRPSPAGGAGDGSTPLYERLALYERYGGPPPADAAPPRNRPPLYQVGGRYRGDDWPTDPGFRRGDLGLEDLDDDPTPEPSAGTRRPAPGRDPAFGGPDPGYGEPRRDPTFGDPDPSYGGPRRDPSYGGPDPRYGQPQAPAGQTWHGASYPPAGAPGYPPHGDDGPGRAGATGYQRGYEAPLDHHAPRPAPASADGRPGAGGAPRRGDHPQRPERPERRHAPEPVTRIRPETPGGQGPGREGRETWERNVTPAARVAAVEDAKLLAFIHDLIQRLKNVPSVYPRLVFLVFGYAAITSLAFAYAEAIPLPITASLVVIPAAGIIYNMGMRYPDWGRRALVGWISGIVATIIYDCLRLALVKVGIWGDPIPGIGRLVFADPHANFAWGYFWRFAGNGGGMGIAYAMLPWRGIRTGVAYGTLICTGLVALLFFFPVAQVHFFPLTPVTTVGAYAGHWVYGAVLGKLASWWLPPVELGRIHGRLTARLIHPGHRPRASHARSSGVFDDLRRGTGRSA
jgi:hypothetical protein